MIEIYGNEEQNDLMNLIDEHKEDDDMEVNTKIVQLEADIDAYKQALEDARNALATAEMELNAALEAEFQG